MLSRRTFCIASSIALAQSVVPAARAQGTGTYPDRLIKLVVPLAAGGAVDVMARLYAERLSSALRQPVVVEPRPGAGGLIGAGYVSKSPADGHTLLFTNSGLIQSTLLVPDNPFRMDDLAPVTLLAYAPPAFAVDAALPVKDLADFIRLVKANPKKYSFGSSGPNSSGHLLGETLNRVAGIDLLHVPFAGEGAAIPALLSGTISALFGAAGSLARQASFGKFKVLALASPKRLAAYPDLPTFAESGVPEVNLPGWIGVFAPAGTPKGIVQRLAEEFARVSRQPAIHAKVSEFGFDAALISGPEFASFVKSEQEKWAAIIRQVITKKI